MTQFPLDCIHIVCLGEIKILLFLKEGPIQYRLSGAQLVVILENLTPSELARQPSGLDKVKRWKTTEYFTISIIYWVSWFRKCTKS